MKVKLDTKGKAYFSEHEWQQIHDAFIFFNDKYSMNKYPHTLYVTFPARMGKSYDGGDLKGEFEVRYKHNGYSVTPSRLLVKICANSSMHNIFKVIFHEMTHVLQELRGDFKIPVTGGGYFYRSTYYAAERIANASYEEYLNFPWEIEANAVAAKLLREWYDRPKIKSNAWQALLNLIRKGMKQC